MGIRNSVARKLKGLRPLPLRLVLIVPLLIQITIAVGITGYFSWRNGQKTIDDLALRLTQEVSDHIENHIRSYTEIPRLFIKINEIAIQTGNLDVTNYSAIAEAFWEQIQLSEAVPYLYFSNSEGEFVGVWSETDDLITLRIRTKETEPIRKIYQLNAQGYRQALIRQEEFDPRLRPWYEAAVKAKQATWSPVYVFAYPPRLGISYALPIYDDSSDSLLGILAADLTLTDISDFLQQLHVSETGNVFIVERSGNIVASSTTEPPFLKIGSKETRLRASNSKNALIRETSQALLAEYGSFSNLETSDQLTHSISDQNYFIQTVPFSPQKGLDWLVVVVIPKTEFTEFIEANNHTTLILCFAALIIASGIGFITTQWIAKPLLHLSRVLESFANNAISINFMKNKIMPINKKSAIHEVQVLNSAFDYMTQQLRLSFRDLAHSNVELEKRVAERTKELASANRQLQRYATIDGLTQVANRRRFNEYLEYTWKWLARDKESLSLILCDVDRFKLYNDTYGHQAGDACLQQIATAMMTVVKRPTDLVTRYGGEEFAIILPQTRIEGAKRVAEKTRQHIKQLQISHTKSTTAGIVTLSFGVVCGIPTQKLSIETLIALADQALYQAKSQGRDRIVTVLMI